MGFPTKSQYLLSKKNDLICDHSAGKHDRGPLFLHYFHLDSSEVVQLVQFKFKIF